MKILGCDWDDTNRSKLSLHELTPEDVETLLMDESGEAVFFPHPTNVDRWMALGFVPGDRFVLVVFEYWIDLRWARVVTAYETEADKPWEKYKALRAARHRR